MKRVLRGSEHMGVGVTPLQGIPGLPSRVAFLVASVKADQGRLLSQSDQWPLWMQGEETAWKTFPLTWGSRSSLPTFEKS